MGWSVAGPGETHGFIAGCSGWSVAGPGALCDILGYLSMKYLLIIGPDTRIYSKLKEIGQLASLTCIGDLDRRVNSSEFIIS